MAYVSSFGPGAGRVRSFRSSCRCSRALRPSDAGAGACSTSCGRCRRLRIPFRAAGPSARRRSRMRRPAYESANTMQPAMLAGVNFTACGRLAGGRARMGYEKFMMDADQAGCGSAFAKRHRSLAERPALDAILANEPGSTSSDRAHPRELRDRVLSFAARRQQQPGAVGAGGLAGPRATREPA